MNLIKYISERKKIVIRLIKNWTKHRLIEPFRSKGKQGEPVVIFVRQNARSRIFNHGYILSKNEGVRTILIAKLFEYEFQKQAFDEIHYFIKNKNVQNIVRSLSETYDILAVVGSTQPASITRNLIDMPRNWPVLIDQHDSSWSISHFAGLDLASPEFSDLATDLATDIADEIYCFNHVDGIIARSGELPALFAEQNVTTPCLLLEDGCNPIFFQPLKISDTPKGKEWSTTYTGMFHPMNWNSSLHGDTQLVPWGKVFKQERVHFHLYPSPHHNYQYPEYIAETARNSYFHLEQAVDFRKVHREISQYDFGWFSLDSRKGLFFSETYVRHYISAKLYTYLEAGLPIIANINQKRSIEIIRESGAGIVVKPETPEGVRAIIEQHQVGELIQGVQRARQMLDVNKKSQALFTFIKDIQDRYNRNQK